MDFKLIVACDLDWNIGREGELPFHISNDLKRFKAITMTHPIVYGRKTLNSFPGGKPLIGRPNIILSRNQELTVENAVVVHTFAEMFAELRRLNDPEPFLIGGGNVFNQLLPYCTGAYVTRVLSIFPADTRLINLDVQPEWTLVEKGSVNFTENLAYRYDFYRNRKPLPLP